MIRTFNSASVQSISMEHHFFTEGQAKYPHDVNHN